jgi:arylsulfatase A-like enzyme
MGPRSTQAAQGDRPNVLFIAVDDLNDWMGCLGGHPQSVTPHFNDLAMRGVLFEKAYSAAPVCNPSRASLMTGHRPWTTGVYNNEPYFRDNPKFRDVKTIPQHFADHGYSTHGGGKIFHSPVGDKADQVSFQNNYFPKCGTPKPKKTMQHGVVWPSEYQRAGLWDWGPLDVSEEECQDWQLTDAAGSILNRDHDAPFFLACGIFRPHLPWFAPQKYFDKYPLENIILPRTITDDLADLPPEGVRMAGGNKHAAILKANAWPNAVQGYLAATSFADACLGNLLHQLDNSPYRDNTVVVLWGDHGWSLGEKEHWSKFTMWEESCRNPMMFTAPGVTPVHGRCSRPVSLIDIYPTLCDLCNVPHRDGLEGRSILPLLEQPGREWEYPAISTRLFNNHTVRDERWRYIRYNSGAEELYDHANDEMEWNNLAEQAQYRPVMDRLRQWLPKENAPDLNKS